VAARALKRTIAALRPALQAGQRMVVLEPSCAAVFRSDAAELLASGDARLLARQTTTLAKLLRETGWRPRPAPAAGAAARPSRRFTATSTPSRASAPTVICSAHAAWTSTSWTPGAAGWRATSASSAATTTCRSPAPSTGYGPRSGTRTRVPSSWPTGFSCRTQIEAGHLGREGIHLAQLLAGMLGEDDGGQVGQP
jgi:hypothetical protein